MESKPKDAQKELETALAELEERVDRLRALYEQYFMGYEKLEPQVQRKDVERRFTVLRKQQIRNTGARFRFNVITQKYNTYGIYWARICRQIEEGTYKRHIAKAARRFAGDAPPATMSQLPPKPREPDPSIEIDLFELDAPDLDLGLDELAVAAPAPAERPPLARPVTPMAEMPSARVARHAALPPGTKQPVLVRRNPQSAPAVRGSPPAATVDRAMVDREESPAPVSPRIPPSSPAPVSPQRPVTPTEPFAPKTYRPVAAPPGSAARMVARPPAAQPQPRPVSPPPQSPAAAPPAVAKPPLAAPPPAVRPPSPSSPGIPPGPPSSQRRPPPPLPSQIKKT